MTATGRRPFFVMENVTVVTGDKAGKVLSRINAADVQDVLARLRTILKRAGVEDAEGEKMLETFAAKCGDYPAADGVAPYRPFGGALSFADVDTYEAAAEQSEDVAKLNHQFQAIFVNAINDPDLTPTQRAATIGSAASDLETRLGQISQGQKGILDRLIGRFGGGDKPAAIPAEPVPGPTSDATGPGTLSVFKDVDGRRRFLATWTNQFRDRQGQVFPEAAHKEYVEWADATHQYPELRLWHIPYAVGQCDMVAYHDGFMLGSGTFHAGMEDVADALADDGELGMSHGYRYAVNDLDSEGVFHRYRSFEVSALPRARAANEGTAFVAVKEVPMLTAEKRAWLEGKVGPERVAVMEENTRRMRKELEANGVGYKDYIEALQEGVAAEDGTATATATTTPAPASAATPAAAEGAVPAAGSAAPAATPAASPGNPANPADPPVTDPAAQAQNVAAQAAAAAAPAPEAEGDKALGAITAALEKANAPILTAIKSIADQLADHEGKLNALRTSKDEDIANAWKSGTDAAGARAVAASRSADNLVTAEAVKERTGTDPATVVDQFKDAAGPSSEYVAPYLKDMLAAAGNGIIRNQ